MRGALLALGLVALAGCVAPRPPGPFAPAPLAAPFTLDRHGLQPHGTARRIDFSRAQAGVIETVGRLLAAPPSGPVARPDCGAGRVVTASWENGLTLVFEDGDFRGWSVDAPGLRTTGGLAVGQVAASAPPTDGITARMGAPGPRIAALSAGLTCPASGAGS